jgi:sporulation protein YlmC with PRC-barrel domain
MSREKQSISIKELVGKQVIDNKGSLLGVLKDIKLTIGGQEAETLIELKNGEEVRASWSDIQSVEDFVLLKKTVKVKAEPARKRVEKPAKPVVEPVSPPPVPPPSIICPNCGAKAPTHAKFCPKCGRKTR